MWRFAQVGRLNKEQEIEMFGGIWAWLAAMVTALTVGMSASGGQVAQVTTAGAGSSGGVMGMVRDGLVAASAVPTRETAARVGAAQTPSDYVPWWSKHPGIRGPVPPVSQLPLPVATPTPAPTPVPSDPAVICPMVPVTQLWPGVECASGHVTLVYGAEAYPRPLWIPGDGAPVFGIPYGTTYPYSARLDQGVLWLYVYRSDLVGGWVSCVSSACETGP